ncbi:lipoate--protein ligase family protein, partial [Suipraeoptans intestinalis]
MLYIESGSNSPSYNFALEYYLMTEKLFDDMVFLFWRTTPTLMVGKFQNTYSEIDLDYARSRKIRIVRRLSGGGTIYTDMGSWQFTFISPNRTSSPSIEFTGFIQPVVAAVRDLGVDASFNGRNDLVVSGKKFSGNAQYIKNGRTLHHGSILFDTDLEEMVRASTVDPQKVISKGIKSVRDRVTNLKEHLPRPLSMEEFKAIMIDRILGNDGTEYLLSTEDQKRILLIQQEQFDNPQKIFGANPRCQLHLKKYFPGAGTIHS